MSGEKVTSVRDLEPRAKNASNYRSRRFGENLQSDYGGRRAVLESSDRCERSPFTSDYEYWGKDNICKNGELGRRDFRLLFDSWPF